MRGRGDAARAARSVPAAMELWGGQRPRSLGRSPNARPVRRYVIAALDGNVGIVLATVPCCGSTPSGRSSSAKPPTSAPADFQLSGTGADNLQHRAPGRRVFLEPMRSIVFVFEAGMLPH